MVPGRTDGIDKDWFHFEIFEWMWRKDGLALRPGAELYVYATIYRATTSGGGFFVATNESMGEMLGLPRETISRTVSKLLKANLVWTVGKVHDGRGGKPVKCYAVCFGPIARVQASMSARRLTNYLVGSDAATERRFVRTASDPTLADFPCDEAFPQVDTNVTNHHIASVEDGGAFQHSVTNRHASHPSRDKSSREQCDDSSHVTKRHIAKNGFSPAHMSLFDMPLISSYHVSPDQTDMKRPPRASMLPDKPHGLTAIEEAAFESLLAKSLRPVDEAFVDDNRTEFARILEEGVPADVILTAYDDYATYQRRLAREQGELRPMHLLNWLRQTPNRNIQYLMNARDENWRREHAAAARAVEQACDQTSPNAMKPKRTHEHPDIFRCIDGRSYLWFVTDERGTRFVEGSVGVIDKEEARKLYESMYEREGDSKL